MADFVVTRSKAHHVVLQAPDGQRPDTSFARHVAKMHTQSGLHSYEMHGATI